ncbi:AglZ/HisF2 family acetamidino modification protein [Aliarcobacter cryaerophilus]|uniref:AglZ/HisF2 family acetamidino modification protein n=1 Tax=Aliarcobacter cryaerophilus TaxID=28198 RepID=UPI0021B55007|nr:AglZ/HisF2 family acetamidino modification protein [Aliarcobacter cryaerophilus]MCT7487113.1 AglZ/HisF2 family acetamidino modification protein [Aliarcobacter cryaerophilus]MCT7491573.1 AglZ/HisF2 family acetamidino modification protein [Aliarcobacter cryaerophilus]
MLRHRIIPSLLIKDGGLYKGTKFKDHKYVGDPINALKIFNEKEVDEIVLLDISATKNGINFELIKEIATEAFFPLGYGGGIKSIEDIKRLFNLGIEKVVLNTWAINNKKLISEASSLFGAQSIVVSVDYKKSFFGKLEVYSNNGVTKTSYELMEWMKEVEQLGAGEIYLNSIERDGTMTGYDVDTIKKVASYVNIPLIVAGGASKLEDFKSVIEAGASAVSAGAMFVFHGKHKAVLIQYPKYDEFEKVLKGI